MIELAASCALLALLAWLPVRVRAVQTETWWAHRERTVREIHRHRRELNWYRSQGWPTP
jgi:DNA-binding IclR family transcriptional regulator